MLTVMILAFIIFFIFALTGCSKVKARLSNGEEVTCSMYEEKSCGVSFYRCEDGKNRECETGFVWVEK